MSILSPDDFVPNLTPGMRVMALDVGAKTIGLATVAWGTDLVMPLKTILRVKFTRDVTELLTVMRTYDVRALVVGWPLLPSGEMGKRCQSVRDFTAELDRFLTQNCHPGRSEAKTRDLHQAQEPQKVPDNRVRDFRDDVPSIPITYWDERLSTVHGDEMVDNIGITAGKSVHRKRDDIIDSLAAQQILIDFVEQNT